LGFIVNFGGIVILDRYFFKFPFSRLGDIVIRFRISTLLLLYLDLLSLLRLNVCQIHASLEHFIEVRDLSRFGIIQIGNLGF